MVLRPIFYDTETTGLKADTENIIEIAAYDPVRDKTFEQLINPERPIPPESSRIHNITDEMVAASPTFSEVIEPFTAFCEGDVVLIAHNNDGFDIHFLRKEFSRCGVELPEWKFFDTLKWARRYRPDLPKHALQFLREIYGIPGNTAHRALDDVIILHKVFAAMTGDLSMETVYSLMNEERKGKPLDRMPFGKHQGKPLDKVPPNYVRWLADSGAFDKQENEELKKRFEELGSLKPVLAKT
jgi:DNA polymerase III subunit epsilon